MSKILNQNLENNGVNRTRPLGKGSSPSRCFLVQQRGPDCHQVTTRTKFKKEVNKVVMKCLYRNKTFDEEGKPFRGYRQRMFREQRGRGLFESTEQRVYDQVRAIRKNVQLYNLNWKQLKDKQKMNFRLNLVKMLQRKQKLQKMKIQQRMENDDRVNDAIKYFKSNSIAETNDLQVCGQQNRQD